ncbi:MAG TPA: cupin domain-containing protein [Myxococcaceae bacterium]|nr:cupin domain-containing protein [Myxococcaceae bacterium]
MIRKLAISSLLLTLTLSARALADAPMTMLTPADIKWGDAPPVFPKGSKMAVLYGDPSKPGELFIVRLKMPAGYKIPAHWHPTDENITVISGTFALGMGDKLDAAKAKAFPAGSFAVAPAKMNHYALAKTAAIVDVAAIGPFALTYVNPADDPSKTATK